MHRLMHEGNTVTGAYLMVDAAQQHALYRDLKDTPRVANVSVKRAMLESFLDTIANNQQRIQAFNVAFAIVIAFGVVYNTARIALSERSRELATLRVIGFTRGEVSVILLGELAVLRNGSDSAGVGDRLRLCRDSVDCIGYGVVSHSLGGDPGDVCIRSGRGVDRCGSIWIDRASAGGSAGFNRRIEGKGVKCEARCSAIGA